MDPSPQCSSLSAKAKNRPARRCGPRLGERHDRRAQDTDSHAPGPNRTKDRFSEGVEHPRLKRHTPSPQRHTLRRQPAYHLHPQATQVRLHLDRATPIRGQRSITHPASTPMNSTQLVDALNQALSAQDHKLAKEMPKKL